MASIGKKRQKGMYTTVREGPSSIQHLSEHAGDLNLRLCIDMVCLRKLDLLLSIVALDYGS